MELLYYINPFKVYQEFVSGPIESFVTEKYTKYIKKTNDSITSVKVLLYKVGVILVFFSGILCISIFMYVIFYYIYMANVTQVRPVHLQYKSCDEKMGVCSFPSAHVQLMKRSQMVMFSQPHRVKVVMEVPETQMNKNLGMFMVCVQMRAEGALVSSSCRSAMLKHRSRLHYILRTLVYAVLIVSGLNEENQVMEVELFNDFQDNQTHPVTDAYVELQSRFVQVLSCELHIEAHFTGLRYVMYYWPKISALIDHEVSLPGICTNLFLVSLTFILSWNHLHEDLPDDIKPELVVDIKNEKMEEKTKQISQVKLERQECIPFIEQESLIEKLENLRRKKHIYSELLFGSLLYILNWYNIRFGLPDYIKIKPGIKMLNKKMEDEGKSNGIVKSENSFTFVENETVLEEFQVLEEKKNIYSKMFFGSLLYLLDWFNLLFDLPDIIKIKPGIKMINEKMDEGESSGIVELENSFTFAEKETVLEEFQELEEKKNKD